jgi:hypothetical protein
VFLAAGSQTKSDPFALTDTKLALDLLYQNTSPGTKDNVSTTRPHPSDSDSINAPIVGSKDNVTYGILCLFLMVLNGSKT